MYLKYTLNLNLIIKENFDFLLNCRLKDGKEIATTEEAKPKKMSETAYQLEIPSIGKDASGAYKARIGLFLIKFL